MVFVTFLLHIVFGGSVVSAVSFDKFNVKDELDQNSFGIATPQSTDGARANTFEENENTRGSYLRTYSELDKTPGILIDDFKAKEGRDNGVKDDMRAESFGKLVSLLGYLIRLLLAP